MRGRERPHEDRVLIGQRSVEEFLKLVEEIVAGAEDDVEPERA